MTKPTDKQTAADYKKRLQGFYEVDGQIWRYLRVDWEQLDTYHSRRIGRGHLARIPAGRVPNVDTEHLEAWVGGLPKQLAIASPGALEAFFEGVMARGPWIGKFIGNDREKTFQRPKGPMQDPSKGFYPFACGTDAKCDYLFDARTSLVALGKLRTREVGFSVYVYPSQTALVMRSKNDVVVVRAFDALASIPDAPVLMDRPPRVLSPDVQRGGCAEGRYDPTRRRHVPRGPR